MGKREGNQKKTIRQLLAKPTVENWTPSENNETPHENNKKTKGKPSRNMRISSERHRKAIGNHLKTKRHRRETIGKPKKHFRKTRDGNNGKP